MKKLILLCMLLACLPIAAQKSGQVSTVRHGSSLPATCDPTLGQIFMLNSDGLYGCTATNTWTKPSGGGGTWGSITGILSSQTDLNTALNGKVPTTTKVNGHALSADVVVTGNIAQFNPAGDGTTDDSAVFTTAQGTYNDIWLDPSKSYAIGTNVSLSAALHFPAGAQIVVKTGVTLTLTGKIDAPIKQIFTVQGTGKVVLGQAPAQKDVYPEWWGAKGDWNGTTGTDDTAAIQAAISAVSGAGLGYITGPTGVVPGGIGWVVLGAKSYKITSALTVAASYVGIRGHGIRGTFIVQSTAGADVLDVTGTGTSSTTAASWVYLQDFALMRSVAYTGTPAGLRFTFGLWDFVDRVTSFDSYYDFYAGSTAGHINFSSASADASIGTVNTGFYLNGAQNSSRMDDCIVSETVTYGAYLNGVTDLFAKNFETGTRLFAGSVGVYINGAGADIHFIDPIIEAATTGIYINGYSGYPIEINGGYIYSGTQNIFVLNSSSVIIHGTQFIMKNGGNAVLIRNSSNVQVLNTQSQFAIGAGGTPFVIDGAGTGAFGNIITGNEINVATVGALGANAILVYHSSATTNGEYRNIVTSNFINGFFTNGIALDSTAANNTVIGNQIDPTNVTTPISNGGTNNGATFDAFTYDFSSSAHLRPVGGLTANKPATCSPPEVYFATDATAGQNWYFCTATNTWTQQLNSGGGSGTVNANSTSNTHALAVYVNNAGSTAVQADTGAFSDAAGNMSAASVTGTDTTHAGLLALKGQTLNPTIPANAVGWLGPSSAAFTSYVFQFPSTAPAANAIMLLGAPSTNVAPVTYPTLPSCPDTTGNHLNFSSGTFSCGTTSSGSAATTITVANAGTTGTTVNTLTKLTGAPSTAVIAATTDTGGVVGVTSSGAGTTGSATITYAGTATCVFDGATTAGDYVSISATTAGNCHDAGSTYPSSGQVVGRVLSTNAAGGSFTFDIFPAEIRASSGGGNKASITCGATNSFNPAVSTSIYVGGVTCYNDAPNTINANYSSTLIPATGTVTTLCVGGYVSSPGSAENNAFTLQYDQAATAGTGNIQWNVNNPAGVCVTGLSIAVTQGHYLNLKVTPPASYVTAPTGVRVHWSVVIN